MPGSFITPLLLTIWYHTTISISLPTLTNLQHCALTALSNLNASEAWSRGKTWCWRSQSPKGTLFSITRCRTWHLLSGTHTWKVSPSTKPTQLILPILFTNSLSFQHLYPITKRTPKGAIELPKHRHLMPLYIPLSTLPGLHLLQKDTKTLDYISQP